MKKTFKFFMVAAIVAAGFVGCSSEDVGPTPDNGGGNGNGDKEVVEGIPTNATFEFISSMGTKSSLLGDASESDEITSIRLLVFQNNTTGVGQCEADTIIPVSGGNRKSATVLVSSGSKKILVIANTLSRPYDTQLQNLKGQTLSYFLAKNATTHMSLNDYNIGTSAIGTTPTDVNLSQLVENGKRLFSNSLADSSCVKQLVPSISASQSAAGVAGEAHNFFKIYVQRAVAKVVVFSSAGTSSAVPTVDGEGTLTNLTYGVRNLNRAVALFQIPNASDKPEAPFFNAFDATSAADMALLSTYAPYYYRGTVGELDKVLSTGTSSAPATAYYIPENANNTAVNGNTTYTAIRARYTAGANRIITSTHFDKNGLNKFDEAIVETTTNSGQFYRILGKDATAGNLINSIGNGFVKDGSLFRTQSAAHEAAFWVENPTASAYNSSYTLQNIKIQEYTDGYCYYRLNINQKVGTFTNEYVKRNLHYKLKITAFNTLGDPTVDDLDKNPEKPIDEPTHITAEIEVLPWVEAIGGGVV